MEVKFKVVEKIKRLVEDSITEYKLVMASWYSDPENPGRIGIRVSEDAFNKAEIAQEVIVTIDI